MKIKAYAKINLFLDILYKRNDNYHELDMIMQTISLYDEITLKKNEKEIIVECSDKNIPSDETNIAYKVAKEFFHYSKIKSGIEINIQKNIPAEAGLGGGSSDGAAVLKGLNHIYKTEYNEKVLEEIGLKVGSDIPFLIGGGTKRVKGRGEIITHINDIPRCYFVLVKPEISISTVKAYALFDKNKKNINVSKIMYGLHNNDITEIGKHLYNEFEEYIFPLYPELKQTKEFLQSLNPEGCLMTGSGSAIYSLYKNKREAEKAFNKTKEKFPDCILCHNHN